MSNASTAKTFWRNYLNWRLFVGIVGARLPAACAQYTIVCDTNEMIQFEFEFVGEQQKNHKAE